MPADDLPQWWSGFQGMAPSPASARGDFPVLPMADSSPLGAIYV
jgi:hypothetical protein